MVAVVVFYPAFREFRVFHFSFCNLTVSESDTYRAHGVTIPVMFVMVDRTISTDLFGSIASALDLNPQGKSSILSDITTSNHKFFKLNNTSCV